jgi:hypothetical protein
VITDAHGRIVDLPQHGQASRCSCSCTHAPHVPRARSRAGASAVIAVAAVLAAGLVLSVLLLAIRDVIITVLTSTSIAGLALRSLLHPSGKRGR